MIVKTVKQKILAAYMNRNDVFMLTNLMNAFPDVKSKKEFWDNFNRAHLALLNIPVTPLPPPCLSDISKTAIAHISTIENTDAFQHHFGGVKYSFQNVELASLQPIQMFVNSESQTDAPSTKQSKALLNYCFPKDMSVEADLFHTQTGVRCITSRYGLGPNNVIRKIKFGNVSFSIEHPNYLQVVRVELTNNSGQLIDRTLILNGTHRAYELLKAGHVKVPAMVYQVTDLQTLTAQIPQGPGMFTTDFLINNPRPALLNDFISELAIDSYGLIVPSILDINISTIKFQ